jgi:pimeloyl-ACP methyl ester carboxylesterase
MVQQGGCRRRLGAIALAALCLTSGQGCLCFVHSLDGPPKEHVAVSEQVPAPCRNQVHIFLLQGLDPLDLANMDGLTEYLHQLGYIKTHYGQFFHQWSFRKEIRSIHKEDPKARFVVIGFSLGSLMACQLANALKEDGLPIDALIYVGGFILDYAHQIQPDNAVYIANILTAGYVIKGPKMDRAENIRCTNVWHFGLPTHPQTRELLARQLAMVAARVPYGEKVPPVSPEFEQEIPQPRRLTPDQLRQMSQQVPSEWSFLVSRSAIGEPPPPKLAQPPEKPSGKRVPFAIIP